MPVEIFTNMPEIKLKINRAWEQNLYPLSMQILQDCNYFVRVDTGTMKSTSYIASDLEHGVLIWDTPYAKKVYYTGVPSHDVNPNASLMWAEKAASMFSHEWQSLAQSLFGAVDGKSFADDPRWAGGDSFITYGPDFNNFSI